MIYYTILVFFLLEKLADESMAQQPRGDLFLNTACVDDLDCIKQCIEKGYSIGYCRIELVPPRKCVELNDLLCYFSLHLFILTIQLIRAYNHILNFQYHHVEA